MLAEKRKDRKKKKEKKKTIMVIDSVKIRFMPNRAQAHVHTRRPRGTYELELPFLRSTYPKKAKQARKSLPRGGKNEGEREKRKKKGN